MSLNVTQLGFSDKIGGAAIASLRLNEALNQNNSLDVSSSLRVSSKITNITEVHELFNSPLLKFWNKRLPSLNQKLILNFKSKYNSYNNYALLPTGLYSHIKSYLRTKTDIVNMHWLGSNMLSIWEIGMLPSNILWTMHDQWAFCGGEHYDTNSIMGSDKDGVSSRFARSYTAKSRSTTESGFDINRLCWNLKKRFWTNFNPMIICPSNWMKSCVEKSVLFEASKIRVIPNCIDTNKWLAIDKSLARNLLGLQQEAKILLFGAFSDLSDKRKGGDLLIASINHLIATNNYRSNVQLLVFGPSSRVMSRNLKCPVHFLGHLDNDISLIAAYSAADVVLLPSRLDNLPNVGLEAFSCSTPLVAFNSGGVVDIVDDMMDGRISPDFSPISFSACISWCIDDPDRLFRLGINARKKAVSKWSYNRISNLYFEAYSDLSKA